MQKILSVFTIYFYIKYVIQNSLAAKKRVTLKKDHCEKRCEIPDGGCDGRLMAEFLITKIQVNLCCLIQGFGTKFT